MKIDPPNLWQVAYDAAGEGYDPFVSALYVAVGDMLEHQFRDLHHRVEAGDLLFHHVKEEPYPDYLRRRVCDRSIHHYNALMRYVRTTTRQLILSSIKRRATEVRYLRALRRDAAGVAGLNGRRDASAVPVRRHPADCHCGPAWSEIETEVGPGGGG